MEIPSRRVAVRPGQKTTLGGKEDMAEVARKSGIENVTHLVRRPGLAMETLTNGLKEIQNPIRKSHVGCDVPIFSTIRWIQTFIPNVYNQF